jgi:hypothetical protein
MCAYLDANQKVSLRVHSVDLDELVAVVEGHEVDALGASKCQVAN